jgi:hypothetical protein
MTMLTADGLRGVLSQLPLDKPEVKVDLLDGLTFVATVTSASYASIEDHERQKQVWAFLREKLPGPEVDLIEFVFTNAPNEDTSDAAE